MSNEIKRPRGRPKKEIIEYVEPTSSVNSDKYKEYIKNRFNPFLNVNPDHYGSYHFYYDE